MDACKSVVQQMKEGEHTLWGRADEEAIAEEISEPGRRGNPLDRWQKKLQCRAKHTGRSGNRSGKGQGALRFCASPRTAPKSRLPSLAEGGSERAREKAC